MHEARLMVHHVKANRDLTMGGAQPGRVGSHLDTFRFRWVYLTRDSGFCNNSMYVRASLLSLI